MQDAQGGWFDNREQQAFMMNTQRFLVWILPLNLLYKHNSESLGKGGHVPMNKKEFNKLCAMTAGYLYDLWHAQK